MAFSHSKAFFRMIPSVEYPAPSSALRAMSTYNVLATLYLSALGVRGDWVGPLLWPAAVAHAVLSAWCLVVFLRPRGHVRAATTGAIP